MLRKADYLRIEFTFGLKNTTKIPSRQTENSGDKKETSRGRLQINSSIEIDTIYTVYMTVDDGRIILMNTIDTK